MTRATVPDHVAEAAMEALRVLFPTIKARKTDITPDAAAFLFSAVSKLKLASLSTYALFSVYTPIPPATAKGLAKHICKALVKVLKEMSKDDLRWNLISYNFVIAPHRRNLEAHLQDPSAMPCPAYRL